MSKTKTVSVKISPDIKDKIEKYHINTSEILRTALENEIQRIEIHELKNKINHIQDALQKIDMNDVIKIIREDRETH